MFPRDSSLGKVRLRAPAHPQARVQTTIQRAAILREFVEKLESRVHLSYDDRGRISVIVDETIASDLSAELAQYKQDLIGDGWTVSVHTDAPRMNDNENVWDNSTPQNPQRIDYTTQRYRQDLDEVKGMIADDDAEADALKAVVIIGHVTVPYSGLTNYDGHEFRAMPTDQYYADLDGSPATWGDTERDYPNMWLSPNWQMTMNLPGDGRFDANVVPGDGLELSFGRIDMANLGTAFVSSEVDLLKSYFKRNHNYRTAMFRPEKKVLLQTDSHGTAHPAFAAALGSGVSIDTDNWYTKFTAASPAAYLFASRTGSSALSRFDNAPTGPDNLSSYNLGDADLDGS